MEALGDLRGLLGHAFFIHGGPLIHMHDERGSRGRNHLADFARRELTRGALHDLAVRCALRHALHHREGGECHGLHAQHLRGFGEGLRILARIGKFSADVARFRHHGLVGLFAGEFFLEFLAHLVERECLGLLDFLEGKHVGALRQRDVRAVRLLLRE